MHFIGSLYAAILFFLLSPSILLSLPPNGDKYTVAAVHALVFFVVIFLTHRLVWTYISERVEGEERSD